MKYTTSFLVGTLGVVSAKEVVTPYGFKAEANLDSPWKLFQDFKLRFNKIYPTIEEELRRFKAFEGNLAKVAERNILEEGSATHGITKFSDLTAEEFKSTLLGYKRDEEARATMNIPKDDIGAIDLKQATSIDWRKLGGVTPVKDQGQCGSCWAFSATEAIETGYFKSGGKLPVLAPQQIVSCDRRDLACNGGDTLTAYKYVESQGGVEDEKDYPYVSGVTQRRMKCKVSDSKLDVDVASFKTVSSSSYEEKKMYAKIQDTPMSICVDAESWQTYVGGVVTKRTCKTDLDHCVHLVGMNAEGGYWIVKNSWNTDWGEEGYIRVKTDENACGIANEATVVSAEKARSFVEARSKLKDTQQDVIDLIKGAADGFGLQKIGDDCIAHSTDIVDDVEKAVADFLQKDAVGILEGLEELGQVASHLTVAAQKCGATGKEVESILKSLEILKHPKSFAYHVGTDLIVNGADIYKNINGAIKAHAESDYYHLGVGVGTVLKDVLGTEAAANMPIFT